MRKLRQFTLDEDAPLLISWHRGDISAFENLVWKYQKRIFNLALLLSGDHKIACEVTENSFVAAYRNIKSLKSTSRFSSWLVAIALKECRELNDYRAEESESTLAEDSDDSSEITYSSAVYKKLELCIRALPVEQGELILLRYVRAYSLEKIEEILQISGELLLSRLFEAQCTLACWLRSDTENPAELSGLKIEHYSAHPEIQRNFSAYLDNSADGDEKALTKIHLKSCGSCREALAELEWMVEDIKSIPDIEPPHWLAATIMRKVKSSPRKLSKIKAPSHLRMQITVAGVFLAVISTSSYLLLKISEPAPETPPNRSLQASPPAAKKKSATSVADFTLAIKGVFRGAITGSGNSPRTETASRLSVPLPTISPLEPTSQPVSASIPSQPAVTGKSDQSQKREKAEGAQILPPEWGDTPAQNRTPQKNAPLARIRDGELALVLETADPVAAVHDIERAVTATGGKINGRAYNRGNDILYTRVELDRFFDLMSRLGKIGRIQELPQLPEGAEGAVDLTIRW